MSLIECPECKQKISNKATICPKCGYPLGLEIPKKFFNKVTPFYEKNFGKIKSYYENTIGKIKSYFHRKREIAKQKRKHLKDRIKNIKSDPATQLGFIITITVIILYDIIVACSLYKGDVEESMIALGAVFPVMFLLNFYVTFRKIRDRAWISTKTASPMFLLIILVNWIPWDYFSVSLILTADLIFLFTFVEIGKNYLWKDF